MYMDFIFKSHWSLIAKKKKYEEEQRIKVKQATYISIFDKGSLKIMFVKFVFCSPETKNTMKINIYFTRIFNMLALSPRVIRFPCSGQTV